MQYTINKEAFNALSEDMQTEYTLSGDSATLKIEGEGAPSTEAITRLEDKLRIEKEHRKNAEGARDKAESGSEKLKADLDKASGKEEIEKIKAEHQAALEKIRADREAEQAEIKADKVAAMKKETASEFGKNFIDGMDSVMADQFSKRLSVEDINGENVVRVLDADGKPSALSLNELKQEFLENAQYAPIIKQKTGSGGGANPTGGGGAARKSLSEMTGTEEAKFANENPDAYAAMVAEQE